MTNSASPRSPGSAGQKPGRPSVLSPTGDKNSLKNELHREFSRENSANKDYANPPTGDRNANLAAARGDVTTGSAAATSSNGAARVLGNWADYTEDQGPGEDDDFTVVKNKKRRRESPGSPAAAAPSSGTRGAGATRRPRSSTGWAPRAEEVRTTRAHIAEARARQASSTEDHCVFVERSPELEPYHYMRAIDRMFESTKEVFQVTKMNGHFLVGLANKSMAERLVNEGLEVEGTLHRAFPFHKRAERITVGNLPFFVGDAAPPPPASPSSTMEVSDVPPASRAAPLPPAALQPSPPAPSALPLEDAPPAPPPVTPAPSLQTPGSREPAAPTPDVELSIAEETSAFSTSSAKNATRVDLDAFIEKHPSVSFAGTDALGLGREEVLDLLSSRTKAQRKGPLLSPPQCDALAGLIRQILDLRPGAASNLYKVLGQIKAELRTTPAAVPPTPPLPAPRPAEPMLPTTHSEELTPPPMTPPPPAPTDMEEDNPMTEEALPAPRPAKPAPPAPHKEDSFTAMITPPPPLPAPMKQKDLMPDIDTIFNEMIVEPGSRPINWADYDEDMNPGTDNYFTVVKTKKRRRESSNSPTAAALSSNSGGARSSRRLQSSARSVPRAQEIPTTRAHITEARARQASSSEEHCVYLEHGPELQPFHYLRALDRLLGGTAGVVQVSKVNGHQLLGLANRGLAERLINNGLEVEGTLLRAFPFRKRAERITVGNLPFFVEDSAIIKALGPYGRITSIAPKMMKAGPYTYTDGRREAFIVLHEGVTTERLPTRLNITIKGEAWPAYLSSSIKCSRCHGQGHRRANCPLLAGRTTAPGPAAPTSPTSVPPATAPKLPQQPSAQPPLPASPSPTMEVSDVSPTSRAALHPPAALRQSSPAPSALPAEDAPPAPAPSLRIPGSHRTWRCPSWRRPLRPPRQQQRTQRESTSMRSSRGTAACPSLRRTPLVLGGRRSWTFSPRGPKRRGVKAELRTTPAAVPTPPLPAPRPAEPAPPAPHGEKTTPDMATPPPPPSPRFIDERWREAHDIIDALGREPYSEHLSELRLSEGDITDAIIGPEDREPLLRRLSTRRKNLLAEIISAAVERSRDIHPFAPTSFTVSTPHVYTRPCGHAPRELLRFSASGGRKVSRMATNLIRAESPSNAEQKPVRHVERAQPCAALSKKEDFQKKTSNLFNKNQNYANPPAGGHHANPATPTDFVTASFSEAAAQANRSWADLAEDNNHESEEPFITVQRKKRRRGSAESPAAAAPSSNIRGAGAIRRPRSSTGWAPRAEEIRTTRAHIAEARARQASSTEDHCVYVERSPELEPFHYMRAIERMFGGTREVFQLTKMNGHFLVGLANRGIAERLINEGLEVEGTLHRAFPFRKRAERITVGNLPFFVGDAAVISALSSFGRVTSIAPKLMKAGPYIYNDGRREAFIILREGMTIERLPTRLDITIKGEAWPAYLSSGIRCSRCRGQGHRRANCPLLAGRTTEPGPATPTSPTSVPPATAPRLPQQPSAQPPPPASPSPTMEVSDVPPASRDAPLPPAALRPSPPAAPAFPMEETPSASPPVTPAPSLQAPGGPVGPRPASPRHPEPPPARPDLVAPRDPLPAQKTLGPAAPTPDVEMSIVEETFASSTSSAKNATRDDLDTFIEKHPSVSFAGTDALGLGREEVLDLLSSRTKAQRKGSLLSPPQCDALAVLDLRPGAASNLHKVLGQVEAELRTAPTAVPPSPPLPAPQPAGMTPPAPPDEESMLLMQEETMIVEIFSKLKHTTCLRPLYQSGIQISELIDAVLYHDDRMSLMAKLSPALKNVLAEFLGAAIEQAQDCHPD
ncbi:hypothetical protein LAZ67_3001628, partial [Cordylochernes scorpioides]